ncbi:LANO_0E10198g1_1 [Lachancea nothofagi CBS 11611]|uniref:LANO_0E10198g1_1 n=1 Tax=Lachancea nothofagi CBS 11611 TaxID=1266666 RepID=A0A1G4JWE2_9SACH|nr:LANO_0E10198g1_1 [Lachancea nothofagi CBS 11611]
MGYVTSGYATRPNKRAKKVLRKVYYERVNKAVKVSRTALERHPGRNEERHMKLVDLPQDVLERIFVFSGRNNALPILNRRFHRCLKPTRFLINCFLRSNYISDVNGAIHDLPDSPCSSWIVLAESVFRNRTFLQYLEANPSILDSVDEVTNVESLAQAQQQRLEEFSQGQLQDPRTPLTPFDLDPQTGKPLRDYPPAIYDWPAIFFRNDITVVPPVYNELLLCLHSFYAVQHPSLVAESAMQWFFKQNEERVPHLDINHLFYAVNFILHISVQEMRSFTDPHPLIQFVTHIYVTITPWLSRLLLCEKLEAADLISARKAKIVKKFIRKFYRDCPETLSHDDLWLLLNKVKDRRLLETVTEYGGKPSFNVVK